MWNNGEGEAAWSPDCGVTVKTREKTGAEKDGRMKVRGPGGVLDEPGVLESYVAAVQTPAKSS